MGYTTKFSGQVNLSRKLDLREARLILEYAEDPEHNPPPAETPPKGYLQWVPSRTLDAIGWDGGEKFCDYVEWMAWLCAWFKTGGVACNGTIDWSGEEAGDVGTIVVVDNVVSSSKGKVSRSSFHPITLSDLALMALDQATTTEESKA